MGVREENRVAGAATDTSEATLAHRDCETKRAIMDAARRRFLHYGYKKTTIDDIALDAGVGKGTVYLYFESKEDILFKIARDVKGNITEQMRCIASSLATPEEKLRRMVLAKILSVHDAYTSTAHGVELLDMAMEIKMAKCGRGDYEQEAQQSLFADVLREGVSRGQFSLPGDGNAETAARQLMLAFAGFFPPYTNLCGESDSRCRVSMESRIGSMLEFLLHGLRRRTPG